MEPLFLEIKSSTYSSNCSNPRPEYALVSSTGGFQSECFGWESVSAALILVYYQTCLPRDVERVEATLHLLCWLQQCLLFPWLLFSKLGARLLLQEVLLVSLDQIHYRFLLLTSLLPQFQSEFSQSLQVLIIWQLHWWQLLLLQVPLELEKASHRHEVRIPSASFSSCLLEESLLISSSKDL